MSSSYIVKSGETISDVVLNSTGSLNNWDTILTANSFNDWTPELVVGQEIVIPDGVSADNNVVRQLATYPACNFSLSDVFDKISAVFLLMANNWILKSGAWNDGAVWIDSAMWID